MTRKDKKVKNTSGAAAPAVDTRSFWERNEASDGVLLTETIKKYAISIFRGILLFGMCFMILQPLLNKLALSFMAEKDLYYVRNWSLGLDWQVFYKTFAIVLGFQRPDDSVRAPKMTDDQIVKED